MRARARIWSARTSLTRNQQVPVRQVRRVRCGIRGVRPRVAPDMAPTNRPNLSSNWTSGWTSRHRGGKFVRQPGELHGPRRTWDSRDPRPETLGNWEGRTRLLPPFWEEVSRSGVGTYYLTQPQ